MGAPRLIHVIRQIGALVVAAVTAAATINAYRPLARNGFASLWSWFIGLVVTEFPLPTLASQLGGLVLTAQRLTRPVRAVSWLVAAFSALGLLNLSRAGRQADAQLTAALDSGLGPDRRTASAGLWRRPAGGGTAKTPGPLRMLRIYRDYAHDGDISYGEYGRANHLDIWRRPDLDLTGTAPVLFQIPGGAWTTGNKRGQAREFGYRRTGAYAPCTFVDEQSGTALYKADFDPYQFLLIPLARITGIEDPALRESAGRNYLYDAWAARFLVTARLNNSLPESDVVLTINPKNARTQDQLHIHISCSSPTTSAALRNVDTSEYVGWKQLPIDLGGRRFQGLAVDTKAFESRNLFRDIYLKVTADGKKMENASIAVANVAQDQFLLLLAEGTEDQPVAAETLQDHDCSITKS